MRSNLIVACKSGGQELSVYRFDTKFPCPEEVGEGVQGSKMRGGGAKPETGSRWTQRSPRVQDSKFPPTPRIHTFQVHFPKVEGPKRPKRSRADHSTDSQNQTGFGVFTPTPAASLTLLRFGVCVSLKEEPANCVLLPLK